MSARPDDAPRPRLSLPGRFVLRATRSGADVALELISGHLGLWAPVVDFGSALHGVAQSLAPHARHLGQHWALGGAGVNEGTAVVTLSDPLGEAASFSVSLFNVSEVEVLVTVRPLDVSIFEVLHSPLGAGLRRVVMSSGQVFFIVQEDNWAPVFAGDAIERVMGVTATELKTDPTRWWREVVEEDREKVDHLKQAVKTTGFWTGVIRRRDPAGVVHPLEWHVSRIPSPHDGTSTLVGVIGDATEVAQLKDKVSVLHRDLAERRDERVQNLLHSIERSREGFALTDPQGCFTYMNAEHLRIFGFTDLSQVVGQPWTILYEPAQIEQIGREVFPTLQSQAYWTGHATARRADGTLFAEDLTLSMLPDGSITCNCRDRTQEIAMNRRLAESERLFREFVDNMPVAVVIRDTSDVYRYVNKAAKRLLPGLLDDAVGRRAGDVLPPRFYDQMIAEDEIVLADNKKQVSTMELHNPDGSPLALELTRFTIREVAGVAAWRCTIGADVTVERRHEEETKAMITQQRHLLSMQREFISLVSHEFRTPLAAMQGAHYLLKQRCAEIANMDPRAHRYMELQEESIQTLRELVNQVLQLNRIDFTSSEAALEALAPLPLATDIVRQFNDATDAPRVRLENTLAEGCVVPLNKSLYRAALENLISNAIKYSPETSEVRVKLSVEQESFVTQVIDSGRGIPPGEHQRAFTTFFRASNVGSVPGTGLGLAIVKRAVDSHGGQVTFESTVGAGSTFRISLPLASPAPLHE